MNSSPGIPRANEECLPGQWKGFLYLGVSVGSAGLQLLQLRASGREPRPEIGVSLLTLSCLLLSLLEGRTLGSSSSWDEGGACSFSPPPESSSFSTIAPMAVPNPH